MIKYLLWKKVVVAISLTLLIGGAMLTECSNKSQNTAATVTKESEEDIKKTNSSENITKSGNSKVYMTRI